MNEAILQAIEAHALTPEAIESLIRLTEHNEVADQQTSLCREVKDLASRMAKLTLVLESACM
jgi:hypothetical protein